MAGSAGAADCRVEVRGFSGLRIQTWRTQPQGLKPTFMWVGCGTTEVVPFQSASLIRDFLNSSGLCVLAEARFGFLIWRRLIDPGYLAAATRPACSAKAAALSVASQVNSFSVRPKWP